MRLTLNKVNDLLTDTDYQIDRNSRGGYYIYLANDCRGRAATLIDACRYIKVKSRNTAIGPTIVSNFNHFVDKNDWEICSF